MFIADMLSRAFIKLGDSGKQLSEACVYQVSIEDRFLAEVEQVNQTDFLAVSSVGLESARKLTKEDTVLQALLSAVLLGWPNKRSEVPLGLQEYWPFRDEITASNGLLFKGHRLIVPIGLRPQVLQRIHSSHLGSEACVRRARDVVFWPGLVSEIRERVESCSACNAFLQRQSKEPLMTYPIPQRPWQMVGQDLFVFNDQNYLVTVDFFSDYWELDCVPDTTAATIVKCTKAHFARHGIPDVVVTDNGPQFVGSQYAQFAKEWEFKHVTSSPYHHQSNGKSESAVKIAKNLLRKVCQSNADVELALLEWRNTPNGSDGFSPAQKLMSRRTRSVIPTSSSLLSPAVASGIPEAIQLRKQKMKAYYDQHARRLPPLDVGDVVRLQPNNPREEWQQAVCVDKVAPRSYTVTTPSGTYRRNRRFLRSDNTIEAENPTQVPLTSQDTVRQPSAHPPNDDDGKNDVDSGSSQVRESVFTRSGRQVKPPSRLGYDVKN